MANNLFYTHFDTVIAIHGSGVNIPEVKEYIKELGATWKPFLRSYCFCYTKWPIIYKSHFNNIITEMNMSDFIQQHNL